jgi:beta-galactosidase
LRSDYRNQGNTSLFLSSLPLTILCCALGLASNAAASDPIPADSAHVRSLDGTWRFKLEQDGDRPAHGNFNAPQRPIVVPQKMEPFETLSYKEDASWHDLKVPANWEMAGFSPATYNQPDNAIGLYRLSFDVPADWKDRIVKLNFDGVQNGAEVYLNGKPVAVDEPSWGRTNYHEGGWDAFQVDLTPAVKFGEKNLLALRVYKNTKSVDLDSGDYFLLGGVHRTVTLFSVPQTHIADMAVRTKLLDGDKAEVRVELIVASPGDGLSATMRLEGQQPVQSSSDKAGHLELLQILDKPRLWSSEHPNLYNLSIDLTQGGSAIEHLASRIGVRELSIKDGVLLLNNVPIKLAGMCRHDCYATLGTALNEEVWRKDIEMMKAANVNAIRTSHYPYGSKFYDLCDELGMYVADEVAACWCPTDDAALAPIFAQHARELVRRDNNHPSVIIWAVGNENKLGKNNKVAADEIRKIDTTRPRLVSWRNAEHADVELDDAHYTPPAEVARANREMPRRMKYPKTYLENPNMWEERNGADYGCLDAWAPVIDRTWREVIEDDHIPGTFLWEWQDRAVVDQCPTKLYDFFPATGINIVKVKGLVDAFRNPRADLYHVKMAYAPIKLDLEAQVASAKVMVLATNYFSFTDLSELKTTWKLLKDGKEIFSRDGHLALPPRMHGQVTFDVPAEALRSADVLRVSIDNSAAGGTQTPKTSEPPVGAPAALNTATYDLRLKPEADSAPNLNAAALADVNFPTFNFMPVTAGRNEIGWRTTVRHPGRLVNISIEPTDSASLGATPVESEAKLYATPLKNVRAMDADVILSDDPAAKLWGHVRVDYIAGHFSWRIGWTGDKQDMQELGWFFKLAASDDHFSWHRKAYWSYYPADHVGRPSGTATPDSMKVDITRITRPDAFDFNSTKYDCDWATLADGNGRGFGVRCTSEDRQQCRAGAADGGYVLVVNEVCAPPRDISSNVVPELYFTLEKNAQRGGEFFVGQVQK